MSDKGIPFFLIAAFLIFTSACSFAPVKNNSPSVNLLPLEEAFPRSVYPAQFTMNHRIIITIDEKEYDFIGYLMVDRKKGFRAMAYGEMGGKVFDLALANGRGEILKAPERIPIKPIMEGVIGDIGHIYLPPDFEESFQVKDKEGKPFSIILRKGTKESQFNFSDKKHLYETRYTEGNRLVSETSYLDYKIYPGWGHAVPSHIKVVNHRWHYSMEITLTKITEGTKKKLPLP